jgi:chemotaxis protein CheD
MRQEKLQPSDSPKGAKEVYLQPGEYFWGDEINRIKTLLGSCVAICVWHPVRKLGGMSHCLLPTRGKDRALELSGRYVDETFDIFFTEMNRHATLRKDYQVKIFGGGNMFELADKSGISVGEKNLRMMREIMGRESMQIAAQHVGGKGHRNVIFELWSGACWVRHAEIP